MSGLTAVPNEDSSKSEDEELARKVPDIDVIISGHTHTKLEDYIKEGDTYIVSCQELRRLLGELRLKKVKGQMESGEIPVECFDG